MNCPHCGQSHSLGTDKCPTTGWKMDAPGMIGTQVNRYTLERLL